MIKPENGKAEMPKDKPPLSSGEIELITRWIAQGRRTTHRRKVKSQYDMAHPPEYTRLPVIPAWRFLRTASSWRLPDSTRSSYGKPTAANQ